MKPHFSSRQIISTIYVLFIAICCTEQPLDSDFESNLIIDTLSINNLNISNYSFATNNKISDIRVYNNYLNFYKIKSLTRKSRNILPIMLNLPTGRRSYLDKVQKYYRHRTPGRRSDVIDMDIISEQSVATQYKEKFFVLSDSRSIDCKILCAISGLKTFNSKCP